MHLAFGVMNFIERNIIRILLVTSAEWLNLHGVIRYLQKGHIHNLLTVNKY